MDILYCVWNANRITNSKHGKIIPMFCKPNDEDGWFVNIDKTIEFNSFTKYRDINLIPFLLTNKISRYKNGNFYSRNGNWIVYKNPNDAITKSNELLENKKFLMLGKIDRLKMENLSVLERSGDLF